MKRILPALGIVVLFSACSSKIVREEKIPPTELSMDFDTLDASLGCKYTHVKDTIAFGDKKAVIRTESLGDFVLPFDEKSQSFVLRRYSEVPEGTSLKDMSKIKGESIDVSLDVVRQELNIYETNLGDGKSSPKPTHCRVQMRMDDYPKAIIYMRGIQSGVNFAAHKEREEAAAAAPADKKK